MNVGSVLWKCSNDCSEFQSHMKMEGNLNGGHPELGTILKKKLSDFASLQENDVPTQHHLLQTCLVVSLLPLKQIVLPGWGSMEGIESASSCYFRFFYVLSWFVKIRGWTKRKMLPAKNRKSLLPPPGDVEVIGNLNSWKLIIMTWERSAWFFRKIIPDFLFACSSAHMHVIFL